MVLLDDQAESYPEEAEGWAALSCEEKLAHARWSKRVGPETATTDGINVTVPMNERVRPRWWYVAVEDCSDAGVDVEYIVHTWNPLLGWQGEFSFDHRNVFYMCIAFLAVDALMTVAQLHANGSSQNDDGALHPMVKILTAGIVCAAGSMAFFAIHYWRFAVNGEGILFMFVLAKFLQVLSKFLLMSILMLVSQGKCISYRLSLGDVERWHLLLVPFLFFCFLLEVWGERSESRRYTTDSVYTSRCGAALVGTDVLFLLVYARNLRESHSAEPDPDRRFFYRAWGSAFGVWFLALPATALLSRALAPWVRFRVILAVSNATHVAALAALMVGLWPSRLRQSYFVLEPVELGEVVWGGGDSRAAEAAWKALPDGPYGLSA